jgi:tripartite-type tricarboxylate transporter receptor subunit TctC
MMKIRTLQPVGPVRAKGLGLLAAAILPLLATPAAAQVPAGYPVKPIRFIVGFPPGGTNDILARFLAPRLGDQLGQQVVVDNRGGANTAIGTELAARAPGDGYTILLNAPGHATNATLMKLPFDPVRDFAFISLVAESQNLVVMHPSLPVRSVKELVALSKKNPGQINYASSGTGTTVHLSAELFQFMTGVKWVHVPYKGGGPALTELMAGQTSLMFANVPTAIQQVRNGKLRPLAVTGAKRTSAAPEVPTVAESGVPGYEVSNWFGIAAPAKTPRAVVERLNAAVVAAMKHPELRSRYIDNGADPSTTTPEQYAAFVESEIAKWAKVIKAAGIKGE